MVYTPPTTRQVADRCGVSVRQVHALIAKGVITPVGKLDGVRGAYLFDPKDVDRLAAELAAAS